MKKLIILGVLITLFTNPQALTNKVYADEEKIEYTNFEALPETFELFSRSDTTHTTTSFLNQEMIITHNNSSVKNRQYFGGLFRLDKNKYYQNFTFEMDFKITSGVNEKSWIGLMYHSQQETNYLSGYLNKYQYGGGSYFVAIDDTATFYNDNEKASNKLNDNNYHNIKINVDKNIVYQYLDNNLISTSSLQNKDSVLGYTKTKGELDLIVSNLTINIKKISILGTSEEPSDTNPFIKTYQDENNIINSPTVILDLLKKENLNFDNEKLPSNIILHVNDNLDVINKNNEIIDTFENILNKYLNHKIIPIVYLSSLESGNKLIEYLNNHSELIDLAIMSKNTSILKQVKESISYIRAIYDVDKFTKEDIHTANKNYANIISIKQEDASIENINYIHARFKTAWVKLNSTNKLDILNTINTGTYGIICENYLDVYNAYQDYDSNSMIRSPFNIAHRGLSKDYNENSLSGCMAAIEKGATHIEIDGYLTTDNEIVIMHDSNVSTTSNGTGLIEQMTLQQVKQLKLDLVEPYEEIPTLKEIIEGMKKLNTDAILIFEIKSGNVNIINRLKEIIDEYNFYDNIVAISFNLTMLKSMKETIPEIPTAYLGQVTSKKIIDSLKTIGEYNTSIDTNRTTDTVFNEQYLKDHGIVGFYWTYGTRDEFEKASLSGFVGLTFDEADTVGHNVKHIFANDYTTKEVVEIGDEITINLSLYNRETIEDVGEIAYLEEYNDYYLAICKYNSSNKTYYSNQIKITKDIKKEEPINENDSNNNITLIVSISIASVLIIGAIVFIIIKFVLKK